MLFPVQVSVHNGWTFVNEPHIVYLEPEHEGGKSAKKPPLQASLRGREPKSNSYLFLY